LWPLAKGRERAVRPESTTHRTPWLAGELVHRCILSWCGCRCEGGAVVWLKGAGARELRVYAHGSGASRRRHATRCMP